MKTKVLTLVLALVLGAIAAFVAARYVTGARQKIEAQERPVEVMVATGDIQRGISIDEMLSKGMVSMEQIPQRYAADGAVSSVRGLQGQVLATSLSKGEQLTESRFQYPSEVGLAYSVPKNLLAITIPVDGIKGVAGLVKPGDHVVVIATFEPGSDGRDVTKILLPKASVLAVGQSVGTEPEAPVRTARSTLGNNGQPNTQNVPGSVTLALTPADAQKVVFAEEKGKVWLALLPATQAELKTGPPQTLQTVSR